jgi:TPR repeat protein
LCRPTDAEWKIRQLRLGFSTRSAEIVHSMGHRLKSSWAVSALSAIRVFVIALGVCTPSAMSQAQPADYGRGLGWHQHAAETGNVEAQFRLGLIHESGLKASSDPVAARSRDAR